MSDAQALYLVLCLLYLSDCLFWVHRHSVAFTSSPWGRWRARTPNPLLGNSQGGLVMAGPLPPLKPIYLSHLWPAAVSPSHVYSYVSQTFGSAGRPRQRGLLVAFKDARAVEVSEREMRINGGFFAKAHGGPQAEWVGEWLRRLLNLMEGERGEEIKRALREAFDVAEAGKRLSAFGERAFGLRILCNVQFAYLFVLAPALAWSYGIARVVVPIAIGMWLLAAAIAGLCWRLHKSMYPRAGEERVGAAAKMILCPPLAVRATDVLASQLLAAYHPLAVAHLLCGRENFERLAAQVLRDLRYPLAWEPVEEAGGATEQWYRDTLREIAEEFVGRCGVNTAELLRPPTREDPSSSSYCPRCHAEYATAAGECADCTGVQLRPFETRGIAGGAAN